MLANPFSLLFNPEKHWFSFANKTDKEFSSVIVYLLVMALIPSACWYYGTTVIGWQVGDGDTIRLTEESAMQIAVVLYIAMIFCISALGYSVHWMAKTYGAESSILKGIALTSLTATPFFLFSVSGLYPIIWLDMILGIIASSWSVYLLYTGIPAAMHIPKDQGFLYSSALVAVALTIFIVLLTATAILWGYGIVPVFAD
jgi:hypothetical protein